MFFYFDLDTLFVHCSTNTVVQILHDCQHNSRSSVVPVEIFNSHISSSLCVNNSHLWFANGIILLNQK